MASTRRLSQSPVRKSSEIAKYNEVWTKIIDVSSYMHCKLPQNHTITNPWYEAYTMMEEALKSILKIIPEDIQNRLQPSVSHIFESAPAKKLNDLNTSSTSANNEIQDEPLQDVSMDTSTEVIKPKLRKTEKKHDVYNEKFCVFISNVKECADFDYAVSHITDMEAAQTILNAAEISARPLFVRRVGIEKPNRPRFLVIIFDNENAQKQLLNAACFKDSDMVASLPYTKSKKMEIKTARTQKSNGKSNQKSNRPPRADIPKKSNDPSKIHANARPSKNHSENKFCVFLKNVRATANDNKFVEKLFAKTKINGEPTYTRRVGTPKPGVPQYLVIGVENTHQQQQILKSKFLSGLKIEAELPKKKQFFRGQSKPAQQQSKSHGFSKEMEEFALFKKFQAMQRRHQ